MKRYNSIRGWFAYELYQQMKENQDIWLITADLGFGMWDAIRDTFPNRFINTGAAEQSMLGIAVGLALNDKIPFCYSITPFLLYRPLEWIKNYLHHENIAVKLVGAGIDKDYLEDGFTHWSDIPYNTVISRWSNIQRFCPEKKDEVPALVREMIKNKKPSFIHLHR